MTATASTSNTVKNQTMYLQNILFFCTNYYMLNDILTPTPVQHAGNSEYQNNPHKYNIGFPKLTIVHRVCLAGIQKPQAQRQTIVNKVRVTDQCLMFG